MRVCVPTKAPGTVLRLARWKRGDGVIEPILKQKRQGRFQELPDRGGAGRAVGLDPILQMRERDKCVGLSSC